MRIRVAPVVAALVTMTTMFHFAAMGHPKMEWIRIRNVGMQDKPLPNIWISVQPITGAESELNDYVRLGAPSFKAVVNFSRSYSCSERRQASDLAECGTIEVIESTARQAHVLCVMERARACGFLHGLLGVPVLKEDLQRLSPITNLGRRLGCDAAQRQQ